MGMTIDEAIDFLEESKYSPYEAPSSCTIDLAIDTMRRYEKIVEIVKEWREVGMDYDSCDAMDNIERVINNGNENNHHASNT